VGRRAKNTVRLQSNEGILSELKINPVIKKTQHYIKAARCLANGQKQTATLNYEISNMWETKPRTTLQRRLDGYWDRSKSRGLKPCKLYDDDDDPIC